MPQLISRASGMTSFTVAGDAGVAQTVSNGQTLTFAGTGGITATMGGTRTLTLSLGSLAATYLTLDQTTPQSVINGRATFAQGLNLGLTPTVGAFAEGKVYYNATKKCLNAEIDTDITLQIGEQELVYCYNPGVQITKGQLVYPIGGNGNFPSIALAKADAEATSLIIGVAIQTIASTGYGFVLVRGVIDGTATAVLDTSAFTVGDTLYLSPGTAGAFTKTAPTTSQFLVRVGVCLVSHATLGAIYIRPIIKNRLADLADVVLVSPAVDQTLRYNGLEWINATGTAISAGAGIDYFNSTPSIIATGTQNEIPLLTLTKSPTTSAEQTITGTGDSSSTPIPFSAWLYNAALGRTTLDAGIWDFTSWANVNNATGTTTITRNVYAVLDEVGGSTVMVTTIGGDTTTLRTATSSGGTPFAVAKIDVGGTPLTDSYLKTTKGLLRIVSRTSDTVVHVATPATYTDDIAGMAFSVWKMVVSSGASPDISTTTASGNYELIDLSVSHAAYAITILHKLGVISFVTSTAGRVVTVTYNGTAHNTHVTTPLSTLHGDLAGLQGGTGVVPNEEYYHLTSAEYTGSGTGAFARVSSPVFTTPNIGTATGSITGNAATVTGFTPASGSLTLAGADALTLTTSGDSNVTLPTTGTLATLAGAETLTNKRVTQRVITTANDASAVIDVDVTDQYELSAMSAATEFTVTGTPTDGQKLIIRLKDDGTTRALTWTFATQVGVTLPVTTTVSKWHYCGFIYNLGATAWHAVAVSEQA